MATLPFLLKWSETLGHLEKKHSYVPLVPVFFSFSFFRYSFLWIPDHRLKPWPFFPGPETPFWVVIGHSTRVLHWPWDATSQNQARHISRTPSCLPPDSLLPMPPSPSSLKRQTTSLAPQPIIHSLVDSPFGMSRPPFHLSPHPRLPGLANKHTGHSVKSEFRINNSYLFIY